MPNLSAIVKNIVEEESKSLHVAFIAKILSVSGKKAKIQPLGLTREYGGTAKVQAPLANVHIAQSAKYKFASDNDGKAVVTPIEKGDLVLCVCCDRNIDAALKGENSLPPAGYHNKSDCIIVAIL